MGRSHDYVTDRSILFNLVMRCLFWQLFSFIPIITGRSLANSNGFFDTQAVTTGASLIESAGTKNGLGNLASILDPHGGAEDDWNELVADTSIETNSIAPAMASTNDCSLAPSQNPRRKQRRQDGFCQSPDAPGIFQLQPEINRKPGTPKGSNQNSPINGKKQGSYPVPTFDRNPCPPDRHYQVCAARFSQVAGFSSGFSLENQPWTEDYELSPGDQKFCRLCKSASQSEEEILLAADQISHLSKPNPEMCRSSTSILCLANRAPYVLCKCSGTIRCKSSLIY